MMAHPKVHSERPTTRRSSLIPSLALFATCCSLVIIACDGNSGVGPLDDDLTLEVVDGTVQGAPAGHALAEAFVVRVRDGEGEPRAGALVRFSVTEGGGSLLDASLAPTSVTEVESDGDGRARVNLTLGPAGGENVVRAELPGFSDVPPVTFVALAGATSPNISVYVRDPDADQLVEDEVLIAVSINSTFTVASVTATLGPVSFPLTFISADASSLEYRATVPLLEVPGDTVLVKITATDVQGDETTVFKRIIHDAPPTLSVLAPIDYSVARPGIDVNVVCSDPPNGCTEVVLRYSDVVVAQGTSEVTGTLQLTGSGPYLRIRAKDAVGQLIDHALTIYVEPSPFLDDLAAAPGVMLDVVGDKMLFIDRSGVSPRVLLRTVGTVGPDEEIFTIPPPRSHLDGGETVAWGRIVPGGAVVATTGDWRLGKRWLYLHTNGVVDTLPLANPLDVSVAGNWLTYTWEGALYRRDLLTGTDVQIPDALAGAVGEDGVVYYEPITPGPIGVYGGDQLPIAGGHRGPLTDGTIVVYKQGTEIRMFDGVSESTLAPSRAQDPVRERDYAVNAGWVAFTRTDDMGRRQVWTRSPAGTTRQVTFFGTDTRIEALGDDGALVLTAGSRRYRATATGEPVDVLSLDPTIVWRDTRFVVLLGRMAFTID